MVLLRLQRALGFEIIPSTQFVASMGLDQHGTGEGDKGTV